MQPEPLGQRLCWRGTVWYMTLFSENFDGRMDHRMHPNPCGTVSYNWIEQLTGYVSFSGAGCRIQ